MANGIMELLDPERYYTTEEAEKWLRVKRDTIKIQIREGRIQARQQGGRKQWVIRGEEILRRMQELGYDLP